MIKLTSKETVYTIEFDETSIMTIKDALANITDLRYYNMSVRNIPNRANIEKVHSKLSDLLRRPDITFNVDDVSIKGM